LRVRRPTPSAVRIDAADDVIVSGLTYNAGSREDFTVGKYPGINGVELWRKAWQGAAAATDEALDVEIDFNQDVVAGAISKRRSGWPRRAGREGLIADW
jgi:hypothetical protein